MASAADSFQPDRVIKARKGEFRFPVNANERTRIMMPHFLDRVDWEGVRSETVRPAGVGWPRAVATGGTATLVVDGVGFGPGSGVRVTITDSERTFTRRTSHTLRGGQIRLQVDVPADARGMLLAHVAIPDADRPEWDAGLEEGDLEQTAPPVQIVRSLLQQVRFRTEEAVEGDHITITAQTSRDVHAYAGSFEIGRLERYGNQNLFICHAGPFRAVPVQAGGMDTTWRVACPAIDRRTIPAQWQIDAARQEAEKNGEPYEGPDTYRGIELIARVRHLGLRSDSTEARRTGADDTGTLRVHDLLHVTIVDARTGAPYRDVRVDLTLPDGMVKRATTSEAGTISLDAVPLGPVRAAFHLERRDQIPAADAASAPVPDDAEHVDAEWRRSDRTATSLLATGTPQVIHMHAPELSA